MAPSYTFRGELWQYPGQAGWHFVTLPRDLAEELRDDAGPLRKAFGSVKVGVSISGQRWATSIFPDSRSNSYLLPVKKAVRNAAGLCAGDEVDVELELEFEGWMPATGVKQEQGPSKTDPARNLTAPDSEELAGS